MGISRMLQITNPREGGMMKVDSHFKYWIEAVQSGLEELGKPNILNYDEILIMANVIQGCEENKSMYFGEDCIPNPLEAENKKLKIAFEKERNKVECSLCKGKGILISYGGTLQFTSQCDKCHGEGKISLTLSGQDDNKIKESK